MNSFFYEYDEKLNDKPLEQIEEFINLADGLNPNQSDLNAAEFDERGIDSHLEALDSQYKTSKSQNSFDSSSNLLWNVNMHSADADDLFVQPVAKNTEFLADIQNEEQEKYKASVDEDNDEEEDRNNDETAEFNWTEYVNDPERRALILRWKKKKAQILLRKSLDDTKRENTYQVRSDIANRRIRYKGRFCSNNQ